MRVVGVARDEVDGFHNPEVLEAIVGSGPQASAITAQDYQAFSVAILRKLIREMNFRFVT
jgi:hypothetical protein